MFNTLTRALTNTSPKERALDSAIKLKDRKLSRWGAVPNTSVAQSKTQIIQPQVTSQSVANMMPKAGSPQMATSLITDALNQRIQASKQSFYPKIQGAMQQAMTPQNITNLPNYDKLSPQMLAQTYQSQNQDARNYSQGLIGLAGAVSGNINNRTDNLVNEYNQSLQMANSQDQWQQQFDYQKQQGVADEAYRQATLGQSQQQINASNEQQKKLSTEYFTDAQGNVTAVSFDPTSGEYSTVQVGKVSAPEAAQDPKLQSVAVTNPLTGETTYKTFDPLTGEYTDPTPQPNTPHPNQQAPLPPAPVDEYWSTGERKVKRVASATPVASLTDEEVLRRYEAAGDPAKDYKDAESKILLYKNKGYLPEAKGASAFESEKARVALQTIDDVIPTLNDSVNTGMAAYSKDIYGTPAYTLKTKLESLAAFVMFDVMAEMKAASQTGSTGLGQLSDREGTFLRNVLGSIDQGMPAAELTKNLQSIKASITRFQQAASAEGWSVQKAAEMRGFDYVKARQDGYTDEEILAEINKQ